MSRTIAIDTETVLATEAEPIPQLVSVAFAPGDLYVAHDLRLPVALASAFAGTDVLAFANAPFDAYVLGLAFPWLWQYIVQAYRDGRIFDVLTAQKLIEIAAGDYRRVGKYGLGAVAERTVGIKLDKEDPWRKAYGLLLGRDLADWPAGARKYATWDAVATLAVALWQQDSPHLRPLAANARAHLVLYGQTLRGVMTDQEAVDALEARLLGEIAEHETACFEAGLLAYKHKIKRPSPLVRKEARARAMLEAIPGVNLSYTDGGKSGIPRVSLSEDALAVAGIPAGHPLDHYRLLGSVRNLRTGWVEPLRSPVVRTRYEECVDTGRTSSSKPSAPWHGRNLQNIPQVGGYRECFRAPPGHVLVVSDFGSLELVTLAQVMIDLLGSSVLGDALREGRDPHGEMGSTLLGIPNHLFDKRKTEHSQKRKLAKALNFGLPGGLGYRRFVDYAARKPYFLEITEDESREYKRLWASQWWDIPASYFPWISSHEDADGLYTITEPRSGHTKGLCTYTEACNFPFQCLGAYVAKRALWLAFEAGLRTVLFVHDEIVSVARKADAERVRATQEAVMIAASRELCPDVPIKIESGVMERYGKP